MPASWCTSIVKPIPKANGESRPISLQPALYKLFVKILECRLRCLWKIIPHHQVGFKPGKDNGCARALSDVLIWDSANNSGPRMRTTLDIKKAFDSISHNLVVSMLKFYGVPAPYINVIQSALCESSIQVYWDGALTPPAQILCGVKQGDPLSPLLFAVGFSLISFLMMHLCSSPECLPHHPMPTTASWMMKLYADDVFLGISNPSAPLLKEVSLCLRTFSRLSNCVFHSGPTQAKSVVQSSLECREIANLLIRH